MDRKDLPVTTEPMELMAPMVPRGHKGYKVKKVIKVTKAMLVRRDLQETMVLMEQLVRRDL